MSAVLLDRDGVINENLTGYVLSWDDFRFLPRSLAALGVLARMHLRLAVVTNQSAIGRGLLTHGPRSTASSFARTRRGRGVLVESHGRGCLSGRSRR
jgi:histidinol phosphatase-like enzyme